MVRFEILNPRTHPDDLGFLPEFIDARDPRPVKEQIHQNYAHGGGWRNMKGFVLGAGNSLKYPGDPMMHPLAQVKVRDELVVLYNHAIVAIIQPDRSFEVSRVD